MLTSDKRLFIASAPQKDGTMKELCLNPRMVNRHGLITGATGTGKTVTLQNMAESFSALGVPVFLTDIKGDLSGLMLPGNPEGGIAARIAELGLPAHGYVNRACPVCFWDVSGQKGHPLRAAISDMGPLLLARLLNLSEAQSGILNIVFRAADDQGLLLLDLKDLRAMLALAREDRDSFKDYGHISTASLGAIQRALLQLEADGADAFFGEPALRIEDLMLNDIEGRGIINILAADRLINQPRAYAALLLWLLSELYEQLPEVGDREIPRLVLMFDEAHLLFDDVSDVLLSKMEQVTRLIRSKGVGVCFITQNPADIPDTVLSQLGNRVQHALRAYTPRDQKAVRAAAESFRPNPNIDTARAIADLKTGEALVSFLNAKGAPEMVERALVLPPESLVGPASDAQRAAAMASSRMAGRYDTPIDRESAYEMLTDRFTARQREEDALRREKEQEKRRREEHKREKEMARLEREREREETRRRKEEEKNDVFGALLGEVARSTRRTVTGAVGRKIGQSLIRGILGGLFGGK
ncbi:helicase HerA-like domain-containing protein [Desulfovibrio sp. SGI.169]|uniref:helicase HerA-like domain-containing protein n=1 Tax=Desulfovibrio sp. SGI.169 TaxID=3420561 RepID=UPI003D083948